MLLAWNNSLKSCGQDFTLLLINYNLRKYEELAKALEYLTKDEFEAIKRDFPNLPELESKLQSVHQEIQANSDKSIDDLTESSQQKRQLDNKETDPDPKRPKNWILPSNAEGMKQLIKEVIREMSTPPPPPPWNQQGRGRNFHGRGRGRGRGKP